jgi:hypothetical protein
MRIRTRILLLMNVMRIGGQWYSDPLGFHFEPPAFIVSVFGPPRLQLVPPKLLDCNCYAGPDTDPPYENNADLIICSGGFFYSIC